MQHPRPNSVGGLRGRDEEQERLLKEVMAEPNWEHEAAKSGMSLVFRKGLLILGLLVLCGLWFNSTASPLVPVLLFLIGTTIILVWDWSTPQEPKSD